MPISCVNLTVERSRVKLLLDNYKNTLDTSSILSSLSPPLFKLNRSSTSGSQLRNSRFVTILSSVYVYFSFSFFFLPLILMVIFVAGGESCKPSSSTSHCAWCVLHILHRK